MTYSADFSKKLLTWFDHFGRKNLPWQKNITPYRVWISEIMLQQTQVATVIPYFERFMNRFQNVSVLAAANLDEVLHFWTGLGYYARARNIHKTAKMITHSFNQQFPDDFDALINFPGIGRSTTGAILSIAFNKATAILDGNVKRVLTRYHSVPGWPGEKKVEEQLWWYARQYTPITRCADYTQAIMDFGATLCTKTKPNCEICPLQETCQAYLEKRVLEFPHPKKRQVLPIKQTRLIVLQDEDSKVLLIKRPLVGIWGGLWSFPECDMKENIKTYCKKTFNCKVLSCNEGNKFRHTFSHFHLEITPVYVRIVPSKAHLMDFEDKLWCALGQVPTIGLAAPVKKLLLQLGPC